MDLEFCLEVFLVKSTIYFCQGILYLLRIDVATTLLMEDDFSFAIFVKLRMGGLKIPFKIFFLLFSINFLRNNRLLQYASTYPKVDTRVTQT